MSLDLYAQTLANGLTAGGIYALVAVGYTLIYGILRFINFAHGEVMMTGAFAAFYGLRYLGLPPWAAFLLGPVFAALLGVLIERYTYRPLRSQPVINSLASAVAVSLILQALVLVLIGPHLVSLNKGVVERPIFLLGAAVTPTQIYIVAAAVLLMLGLELLLLKTRLGREIRAVSDDREVAAVIGIDPDATISKTFLIASALAGVAGVMLALYQGAHYLMGVAVGIKAFTAAVVGGIGSVRGAVMGGLLIGLVENFGILFIPSGYKDAIAFVILVAFLIMRPKGIFNVEVSRA